MKNIIKKLFNLIELKDLKIEVRKVYKVACREECGDGWCNSIFTFDDHPSNNISGELNRKDFRLLDPDGKVIFQINHDHNHPNKPKDNVFVVELLDNNCWRKGWEWPKGKPIYKFMDVKFGSLARLTLNGEVIMINNSYGSKLYPGQVWELEGGHQITSPLVHLSNPDRLVDLHNFSSDKGWLYDGTPHNHKQNLKNCLYDPRKCGGKAIPPHQLNELNEKFKTKREIAWGELFDKWNKLMEECVEKGNQIKKGDWVIIGSKGLIKKTVDKCTSVTKKGIRTEDGKLHNHSLCRKAPPELVAMMEKVD